MRGDEEVPLPFVPLLAALVGGLAGCASADEPAGHHQQPTLASLTPDEVQARLDAHDPSFFVFDANQREVYDAGHVPTAKWVPSDAVTADMLPPDKAATLVFYCANEH
jgi:hypothetical protein